MVRRGDHKCTLAAFQPFPKIAAYIRGERQFIALLVELDDVATRVRPSNSFSQGDIAARISVPRYKLKSARIYCMHVGTEKLKVDPCPEPIFPAIYARHTAPQCAGR